MAAAFRDTDTLPLASTSYTEMMSTTVMSSESTLKPSVRSWLLIEFGIVQFLGSLATTILVIVFTHLLGFVRSSFPTYVLLTNVLFLMEAMFAIYVGFNHSRRKETLAVGVVVGLVGLVLTCGSALHGTVFMQSLEFDELDCDLHYGNSNLCIQNGHKYITFGWVVYFATLGNAVLTTIFVLVIACRKVSCRSKQSKKGQLNRHIGCR